MLRHIVIKLSQEGATNPGTFFIDRIEQRISNIFYTLQCFIYKLFLKIFRKSAFTSLVKLATIDKFVKSFTDIYQPIREHLHGLADESIGLS